MADSCLLSLPSIFTAKLPHKCLSIPPRPIKLHLSHLSHSLAVLSLKQRSHFSSLIPLVAQTSDWAHQGEENDTTITINESEQEESTRENHESEDTEAQVSDWGSEGQDVVAEAVADEGDFDEQDVVAEAVAGEGESVEGDFDEPETEGFVEPPEDAKTFVGNLPYDVDSQKLAELFEAAGTVEIAEVIYNRETDSSRGFGFVTMSTVEEAEKAVEMFHRYDVNGRLLTVNKAAPRGSRLARTPREFEPAYRIYVGNLPWDVDDARLEQVFSEHGKVVDARIVYDRDTGRSRGFGFVTMSTETELNDAIAALDGQSLDGRAIRVNVAEERPRRSF